MSKPSVTQLVKEKALLPLCFALVLLLMWQLVVSAFRVPEYLFPSPLRIGRELIADRAYLLIHGTITIFEALGGLGIAVAGGFVLGTVFAMSSSLERMVLPYAVATQSVPIVATAPLLILWLGPGTTSKIVMAALICFFPMVVSTSRGLRAPGPEQLALMRVFGATSWEVFWKLRLPTSLKYVMVGMQTSAALAMIGAIVAEYAGADRGLGYVIMQATYRLDTPLLFAGIFVATFGGLVLFLLIVLIGQTALGHYRE